MSDKCGYVAICDECEKKKTITEHKTNDPKREPITIKLCKSCLSSALPNVIKKLSKCPETYYVSNGKDENQPKIYLSNCQGCQDILTFPIQEKKNNE